MVEPDVVIRPANEVDWLDLQLVLTGPAGRCQCTRQRLGDRAWYSMPVEERAAELRSVVGCDFAVDPAERTTSATAGIVAFVDGEPAAWAAVDARTAFHRLLGRSPVVWKGRNENREDSSVWSVACLIVRRGFRGRHLTYDLVRAAVDHARSRGARALEGYPMVTRGREVIWDELNVGTVSAFEAAGFEQVSQPTLRRVVMRRDL